MIDGKAALLDALIASVRKLSREKGVFNETHNEVSKSRKRPAKRRIISGSADDPDTLSLADRYVVGDKSRCKAFGK